MTRGGQQPGGMLQRWTRVLIVVDACLAALAGAATNFNEAPNGLQLSMLIIFVLVSAALAWHASRPTLIKKSVE